MKPEPQLVFCPVRCIHWLSSLPPLAAWTRSSTQVPRPPCQSPGLYDSQDGPGLIGFASHWTNTERKGHFSLCASPNISPGPKVIHVGGKEGMAGVREREIPPISAILFLWHYELIFPKVQVRNASKFKVSLFGVRSTILLVNSAFF